MTAGKLKVAMVLRQFSASGGLELYALKLVEGLLQDGHTVTVICEQNDTQLQHANLTVHKFEAAPKSLRKDQKLEYYLSRTSAAVKALGPFDIIHSQHFPVSPVDVVTFHNHTVKRLSEVGYGWEKTLNNAKLALTKAYQGRHEHDGKLAREAKMRIFVGAVMKEDFYHSFALPPQAPFAVAHPGASMQNNEVSSTAAINNLPSASPVFSFLFVGKGYRKKGLDTLLDSCKILKEKGHVFALKIAGIKPNPLGQLQLQLAGLSGCVKYLGFRKDMPAIYASCQATVLPSKIEPFGMAPIQGMQYGLVPIVSRVCGVAEVLTAEKNCLILQNHLDKNELANLMERLMLDRELYKQLQGQAKITADKLNWRQAVIDTEKAYESVLAGKL